MWTFEVCYPKLGTEVHHCYKGWIKVMTTVWYFWLGFIHRGKTFMCLQYSHSPCLLSFAKCLEGVVHHQCFHLSWCSVLTSLKDGKIHLSSCTGYRAVVFSLWRRYHNSMDSLNEYGGCSRISHCQRRKSSVIAAVWLLALSWRMMGFCTTKCCRFFPESKRLQSLRQCERTTARDPVEHKR